MCLKLLWILRLFFYFSCNPGGYGGYRINAFHKKLFTKKEPVKANVTVEQTGNAFRIISIET